MEVFGRDELVEEAARGGRSWKMLKKVDKLVVKMKGGILDDAGDKSGWRRWKCLEKTKMVEVGRYKLRWK
jgi:hypothetical protein